MSRLAQDVKLRVRICWPVEDTEYMGRAARVVGAFGVGGASPLLPT